MSDAAEFETFVRNYQNMVFSTALRLVGNESDALDMAQETLLKAHQRFDLLRNNPSAGGWLKTVVTNLSLNHLSRYRNRWRFFSELVTREDSEGLDALLPGPDNQGEKDDEAWRRFHLEQALQKLPTAQRVPLVLYHFEELSYEEISQRLGISLSKVKTDIHRARQSLRRWLTPNFEDGNESGTREESSPRDGFMGSPRLAVSF